MATDYPLLVMHLHHQIRYLHLLDYFLSLVIAMVMFIASKFRIYMNIKWLLKIVMVFGIYQCAFAQDNGINLSFNNADIDAVVSAISRATNKTIIVDPK